MTGAYNAPSLKVRAVKSALFQDLF